MIGKLRFEFIFVILINFTFYDLTIVAKPKEDLWDSLTNINEHIDNDSVYVDFLLDLENTVNSPNKKIEYLDEALEVSTKLGSFVDMANCNKRLGHVYNMLGQYTNALPYFIEAARLFDEIGEPGGVATIYIFIGDSYSELKDYRNSVNYYRKSIRIFKAIGSSKYNSAIAQLNLGEAFRELDQNDSALFYYKKSEVIFTELGREVAIALCSGNIGLIYGEQRNYVEAENRILSAVDKLKEYEEWDPIADYQAHLADIYVNQGRLKDAMNIATSAYKIATREGIAERIRDASLKLSELYKSTGQFEKAYNYQSQYLIYRDSINNEEVIRRIADLRTEYEVGQKQAEVELEQAKVQILEDEARYADIKFWGLLIVVISVVVALIIFINLYRSRMIALKLADGRYDIIKDQREELDTMNALKDQFFSLISHDLRGPMANLESVTDLIEMHLEDKDYNEIYEVTQILKGSSREVSDLLENLLNWSMSEQGMMTHTPVEVSAEDVCNPALRVLQLTANHKNITLTPELRSEVMLKADTGTVATAIRNLLSNALKFTEEGGQVDLTVTSEGDSGVISVKDNGIGIPENKMDTLFSFTGGRKRWGTKGEKGVGLGLNLVKSFVELNQGEIKVSSQEGVGTEFRVYLPLFKEETVSPTT